MSLINHSLARLGLDGALGGPVDDAIGRTLDRLFDADRAALMSACVVSAYEAALDLIEEEAAPLSPAPGAAGRAGLGCLLRRRFPCSIVVHVTDDAIAVIAFAHHARRSGYQETPVSSIRVGRDRWETTDTTAFPHRTPCRSAAREGRPPHRQR